MDDKRQRMRVSDSERQAVVEVLKQAMDDGRLRMDEYVERMEKAYEAVTIGDLELLHDDLPLGAPAPAAQFASQAPMVPAPAPAPAPSAPTPAPAPQSAYVTPTPPAPPPTPHAGILGAYIDLPGGLRALWTILSAAVAINLVVWVLLGLTTVSFPYPWPLWVAGPAGAALTGISVPVLQSRRAKWEKQRRQLPPR